MPSHRQRSRRTRLALPVILAMAVFAVVGTAAAGTVFAPGPLAPTGTVAEELRAVAQATPPIPTARAAVGDSAEAIAPERDTGAHPALLGGAPAVAGLTGYRWPVAHGRLTLPYGPTPWGDWMVDDQPFHDGVDLATFCGDRIVAAHDGTVVTAGRHFDDEMGWIGDLGAYKARLDAKNLWTTLPIVVVIDDGNGYRSVYAHFGKIVVNPGATVRAGDLLGYEGRTGHASGCHLHYGLFSPQEVAAFVLDPSVAKRMKLPASEIARIDPTLVLPPRPKASGKPSVDASAKPSPRPSASR